MLAPVPGWKPGPAQHPGCWQQRSPLQHARFPRKHLVPCQCPVGFAQGVILRPVVCITTVTVTVSHIQRGHRHSKICHNDVMLQAHTRSGAVAKNDVAANRARRGMQDEQATRPSIIPGYVQLYARRPLRRNTHTIVVATMSLSKCTHSGKLLAYFLRTAASSDKHA